MNLLRVVCGGDCNSFFFILKHMIVRVPELTPDSLWEAKGVIVVQSIIDRKVFILRTAATVCIYICYCICCMRLHFSNSFDVVLESLSLNHILEYDKIM